jgi:WD40 repeat protein
MKNIIKVLFICVCIFTTFVLIKMGIKYIQDNTWPKTVPTRDIIYQTEDNSLNFINADGTGLQKVYLKEQIMKPVPSADGETIYGLENWGYPAYWDIKKGKFKVCSKDQQYFGKVLRQIEEYDLTNGQHLVFISDIEKIIIFNLDTCKEIKRIINYEGHLGSYNIYGISFQHSTQTLLFGRVVNPYKNPNYQIIKYILLTGTEEVIAEGINPSWSPDGSIIAFIGPDGIYIIGSDDPQARLLVKDEITNTKMDDISIFKPILRWSPDGKWIVVHHCHEKNCSTDDADINIIRVSDGFQQTIFAGGEYPAWLP